MKIVSVLILVATVILMSCSDKSINSISNEGIKNVWWRVQSFESINGEIITLALDEGYFLFLNDTLSGKTDHICHNTYYATYRISSNDSIRIDPIITTKVGCRSNYREYLTALGSATSFKLNDDRLNIFYNDNKRLEFVKQ